MLIRSMKGRMTISLPPPKVRDCTIPIAHTNSSTVQFFGRSDWYICSSVLRWFDAGSCACDGSSSASCCAVQKHGMSLPSGRWPARKSPAAAQPHELTS